MKTIYSYVTPKRLEPGGQGQGQSGLNCPWRPCTDREDVAFLSALRFDTILTSPLARARAIAEPVGANLGILPIVMPELREIEFGGWEGHSWNEIGAMYPATLAAWELKSPEARPEGGESLDDVRHRARKVRSAVEASTGNVA